MKVLIVVNNLRVANGVATVIMNQYDALIDNDYKIDFVQFLEMESPYIQKIEENNGKIYTIKKNVKHIKEIFNILKNNKYDIVHINQMNLYTVILIILAYFMKVKHIVYHSHNTKIPGTLKRKIQEKMCNIVYKIFANKYIACSEKAGIDAFGKSKFVILKNSIDVKKFAYNYNTRVSLRQKLNIGDETFVIGTVCRIAKQKNPKFILEIIAEVVKKKKKCVFLWIGSAPSDNDSIVLELKKIAQEMKIEKNILWLGSKTDVYNWYSVMDVFLMPSFWEGLGITYIESQANSLITFASDVVPEDTHITNLIKYLSLNLPAKKWADEICKYSTRNQQSSQDNYSKFVEHGYDLTTAKEDLLKIYNSFK